MNEIKYRIKTKSPLIILTNTPDQNTVSTADYIPGYVLLGALAKIYSQGKDKQNLHKDEFFYDSFLSDNLTFSNAYLTKNVDGKFYDFKPISQFVQTDKDKNKYFFFPKMNEKEKSQVTKPLSGYGCYSKGKFYIGKVEKNYNFHIVREDRIRGFSEEEGIYQYEFIEEGQGFTGYIRGDKNSLENFKSKFQNINTIFIGKSKNTQYGYCEIELSEIREIIPPEVTGNEIHICFNSNAIFLNKFGYVDNSLENIKEYLYEYFPKVSFTIENTSLRTEFVENYLSVKKYKNALTSSIVKGSSFTIKFYDVDSVKTKLKTLLEKGIGERLKEGFGELVLLEYEKIEKGEYEETKVTNSDIPVSKELKKILKTVLMKETEEAILFSAFREANKFENIPANSQFGRLENMLSQSKDIQEFKDKVKKLRKTAKGQLDKCRNKKITLLDFILDELNFGYPEDEKIKQIKNICEEEKLLNFNEHRYEFDKTYLSALFRRMRKMNKNKEADANVR